MQVLFGFFRGKNGGESFQGNPANTILNFGGSQISFETPLCQVSAYGVSSQVRFQVGL